MDSRTWEFAVLVHQEEKTCLEVEGAEQEKASCYDKQQVERSVLTSLEEEAECQGLDSN